MPVRKTIIVSQISLAAMLVHRQARRKTFTPLVLICYICQNYPAIVENQTDFVLGSKEDEPHWLNFFKNGRGGEIRTHDLLYPKQAR